MMQNRRQEASMSVTVDYWALRALAWAFLFTGFILSAVSTKSCQFIEVIVTDKDEETTTVSQGKIGLFQIETNTGLCMPIDALANADLSESHKVAKGMAVLACLVGGINMLLVLSTLCCPMPRPAWILFGGLAFLCVMFQCLTFIFFNDDDCDDTEDENYECRVGRGAAVAIAAVVAYLFGGILSCAVPAPSSGPLINVSFADTFSTTTTRTTTQRENDDEGVKETVTETVNPDGTRTTFITRTTGPSPSAAAASEGIETSI